MDYAKALLLFASSCILSFSLWIQSELQSVAGG